MSIEKRKFISTYKKGTSQLLIDNLIADIETPFSSLLKISKGEKYSFLLESVEGGSKRGRYSLLGCDPDLIWNVNNGKSSIKYLGYNYNYKLDSNPLQGLRELINKSKSKIIKIMSLSNFSWLLKLFNDTIYGKYKIKKSW